MYKNIILTCNLTVDYAFNQENLLKIHVITNLRETSRVIKKELTRNQEKINRANRNFTSQTRFVNNWGTLK